ncbi:hypothetical protein EON66_09575, partial [archaeon]
MWAALINSPLLPRWFFPLLRLLAAGILHGFTVTVMGGLTSPFACAAGETWMQGAAVCWDSKHQLMVVFSVLALILFVPAILFAQLTLVNRRLLPGTSKNTVTASHGTVLIACTPRVRVYRGRLFCLPCVPSATAPPRMMPAGRLLALAFAIKSFVAIFYQVASSVSPVAHTVINILCALAYMALFVYYMPYHELRLNHGNAWVGALLFATAVAAFMSNVLHNRSGNVGIFVFAFVAPFALYTTWRFVARRAAPVSPPPSARMHTDTVANVALPECSAMHKRVASMITQTMCTSPYLVDLRMRVLLAVAENPAYSTTGMHMELAVRDEVLDTYNDAVPASTAGNRVAEPSLHPKHTGAMQRKAGATNRGGHSARDGVTPAG